MTATTFPKLGRKKSVYLRGVLQGKGVPAYVPSGPVRDHVQSLSDLGMTDYMIAEAAGVSQGAVWDARTGKYKTTQTTRAAAIMRVTPAPHPRQRYVLAIGAIRRLQALQAAGWSSRQLAERMGISQQAVSAVMRETVLGKVRWARVIRVYEELSGTPGPSSESAKKAATKGWILPMEWEGYDIDDPRVDPPRSRRRKSSPKGFAEEKAIRQAKVAELARVGLTEQQIADRVGVDARTVSRDKAYLKRVAS